MSEKAIEAGKKAWRTPEIVEVGGAAALTTGPGGNVGDQGTNPRTYSYNISRDGDETVDLKTR